MAGQGMSRGLQAALNDSAALEQLPDATVFPPSLMLAQEDEDWTMVFCDLVQPTTPHSHTQAIDVPPKSPGGSETGTLGASSTFGSALSPTPPPAGNPLGMETLGDLGFSEEQFLQKFDRKQQAEAAHLKRQRDELALQQQHEQRLQAELLFNSPAPQPQPQAHVAFAPNGLPAGGGLVAGGGLMPPAAAGAGAGAAGGVKQELLETFGELNMLSMQDQLESSYARDAILSSDALLQHYPPLAESPPSHFTCRVASTQRMTRAAGKISALDTSGKYSLAARVCCTDNAAPSMYEFDSRGVIEFSSIPGRGLPILPPVDSSVGAPFAQQLVERYNTKDGIVFCVAFSRNGDLWAQRRCQKNVYVCGGRREFDPILARATDDRAWTNLHHLKKFKSFVDLAFTEPEHFRDRSLVAAVQRASTIVIPLLGFPTDAGNTTSLRDVFRRCASLHEMYRIEIQSFAAVQYFEHVRHTLTLINNDSWLSYRTSEMLQSADARVFRQLSKNGEASGIDYADVVIVAEGGPAADRFKCPVCHANKPFKDRIPDMYCAACNVFFRTQTQSYLKKHHIHPLNVKRKRRDAFELLIQDAKKSKVAERLTRLAQHLLGQESFTWPYESKRNSPY